MLGAEKKYPGAQPWATVNGNRQAFIDNINRFPGKGKYPKAIIFIAFELVRYTVEKAQSFLAGGNKAPMKT
ncbi:hypothetical protein AGMMS49944_05450 [Spirochaetia bacterium]|nr:hypothetical protein AGMMS49944_05450 [Spirochaetia bacterium]